MNRFTQARIEPTSRRRLIVPAAPRELTMAEINMVSGGLPLAIPARDMCREKVAGGRFVASYASAPDGGAGSSVWAGLSSVWGAEEAACR